MFDSSSENFFFGGRGGVGTGNWAECGTGAIEERMSGYLVANALFPTLRLDGSTKQK